MFNYYNCPKGFEPLTLLRAMVLFPIQMDSILRRVHPATQTYNWTRTSRRNSAAICVTFIMAFYIPAVLRHEWKVRICTARILPTFMQRCASTTTSVSMRPNLSFLL